MKTIEMEKYNNFEYSLSGLYIFKSRKLQDETLMHKKELRDIIQQLNKFWLDKHYDEIGKFLYDHVVMAPPGMDARIIGRDSYIQSFRDYDKSAKTLEFVPGEPAIDLMGDTAVATYPYTIKYELAGNTYREHGREILMFWRSSGRWLVVWRTMQNEKEK